MERVIHRAASRGFADHGWLQTYHTFSYGNYYDPRRIHFGALRVINEDTIEGGEGYSSHPHDNLEIVLLPLEGAVEHGDNIGNIAVTGVGEVQAMTTGTGMVHNEYNKSQTEKVHLLNIWIYPREYELSPRYKKAKLSAPGSNELRLIVAPDTEDAVPGVVVIAQDAWFYLGQFDEGFKAAHQLHTERHGAYLFVLEGTISVGETEFGPRDGVGIWDVDTVSFTAESPARVLLIEVPMRSEQL